MRTISEELERAEALTEEILKIIRGARAYLPVYSKEAIVELLVNSLRAPPSGEAGEVDLRTLVPGFRLDWSGLRNRLEEDLARLEKLDTYEMRAAHLDEMARQFEDAIRYALPTIKEPTDGK